MAKFNANARDSAIRKFLDSNYGLFVDLLLHKMIDSQYTPYQLIKY